MLGELVDEVEVLSGLSFGLPAWWGRKEGWREGGREVRKVNVSGYFRIIV